MTNGNYMSPRKGELTTLPDSRTASAKVRLSDLIHLTKAEAIAAIKAGILVGWCNSSQPYERGQWIGYTDFFSGISIRDLEQIEEMKCHPDYRFLITDWCIDPIYQFWGIDLKELHEKIKRSMDEIKE